MGVEIDTVKPGDGNCTLIHVKCITNKWHVLMVDCFCFGVVIDWCVDS